MKLIYAHCLLFFLLLGSAFSSQLKAQVSGNYHYEYTSQVCTVPATYSYYDNVMVYNYTTADSADFYVDFGDGNDTNVTVGLYFFSTTGAYATLANMTHTYQAQGMYALQYIMTMPDGNADTVNTQIMVTATCNNVTGRIYIDVNNDCAFNAGDIAMPNYPVHLDYNNANVSTDNTDAQGLFSLSALPGYTYYLVADTVNGPTPTLTCSTFQGMPVTPAPNATQDLVFYDTTSIHITFAADSANFNMGNCAPFSTYFYFSGATMGYSAPADSIDLYINFGDGDDTTFTEPVNGTGPVGSFYGGVSHTYTAIGNYNTMYSATGPDGTNDANIQNNGVVVSDTCGNIEGYVYIDNNNNCIFDAGDSAIVSTWVMLAPAPYYYYAFTDANGHYSFSVSPGNYTVDVSQSYLSFYGLAPSCPASATMNVTVTASNTATADFAMTCPPGFDLDERLFVTHGIFPTSPGYIYPYFANHSCTSQPGSVTLILDPLVHYLGVCDTAFHPTVNGDTLTWVFTGATQFYYWYYWFSTQGCIQVIGDASLQLGDSVCFTMTIDPIAGDVNPANNTITYCVPALVSLDPNVKAVLPRGNGPLGYISQNTALDYTIQFQNTGTSTARNIFILDTLDADLDLSTLIITGNSHYMEPQILPGNVLRFSFPDIYLADSTSDEMHSHGWVSYRIATKPALANGTPIQNTAGIYFDFNAPVMTNSTLNTIFDPLSVNEIVSGDVNVFPNPASSTLEIKFSNETNAVYSLTDLAGKKVAGGKLTGRSATLDVSPLPQGVYLLSLETAEGRSVHKIMVQH